MATNEGSSQINYTYFAQDGNFGDATDLVLVDTDTFNADDYNDLLDLSDSDRATAAFAMATNRGTHAGNAIPVSESDYAQAYDTLEAVIEFLIRSGAVGWAEQLGDIRDLITRKANV